MTLRAKLTKSKVEGTKPGEAVIKVYDTEVSGLSVRVYPNDRRAYYFRYRVGAGRAAKIREPKIGDHGTITADQARSIAKDWAAQVRRGGDPLADRQALTDNPTMSELFDRYLEDFAKRHKKASSLKNDTRMIEKRLRPALGSTAVNDVTRQKIRALHRKLEDTPYEANRTLALLSKVFSFASNDLEWISQADHPVKGIKRFPEKKRKRYLTQIEIARLGEALARADAGELDRPVTPYATAMIRLLILTGARHSEILNLRWDEVNFERGCLELSDSKTGEKEVFLPAAALQVLTEIRQVEGNPFVIVGRKLGTHMVNIKDSWGALRKEAGLEDVRLHDLRHSFASVGARAGMSLPILGALLGHRETATTARYAHLSDDPRRLAADAIGQEIADALGAARNG